MRIGLGTLPARVTAGSVAETTVTILNCDGGGIWCGTVGFAVDSSYPNGRKRLVRTHGNYEGTLDNDLYFFNGITYKVSSMSLNPALFESTTPTPPFGLLEPGVVQDQDTQRGRRGCRGTDQDAQRGLPRLDPDPQRRGRWRDAGGGAAVQRSQVLLRFLLEMVRA